MFGAIDSGLVEPEGSSIKTVSSLDSFTGHMYNVPFRGYLFGRYSDSNEIKD